MSNYARENQRRCFLSIPLTSDAVGCMFGTRFSSEKNFWRIVQTVDGGNDQPECLELQRRGAPAIQHFYTRQRKFLPTFCPRLNFVFVCERNLPSENEVGIYVRCGTDAICCLLLVARVHSWIQYEYDTFGSQITSHLIWWTISIWHKTQFSARIFFLSLKRSHENRTDFAEAIWRDT